MVGIRDLRERADVSFIQVFLSEDHHVQETDDPNLTEGEKDLRGYERSQCKGDDLIFRNPEMVRQLQLPKRQSLSVRFIQDIEKDNLKGR